MYCPIPKLLLLVALLSTAGSLTASAADDSAGLIELKREVAKLREELATLRERDQLRAQMPTVRVRVVKPEVATPSIPAPVRSAYAATPSYKAVPYAEPAAMPAWNGFYIGGAAGFGTTENEAKTNSAVGFAAGFPNFAIAGYPSPPINFDNTSGRIGIYGGYNWQMSMQWVAGLEGDWTWAGKTVTANGMLYPIATAPTLFSDLGSPDIFAVKTTWDASLRARVGYLVTPSVLIYGAGGATWIHLETTSSCGNSGVTRICFGPPLGGNPQFFTQPTITDSSTKLGWTIGGGVEAMVGSGWTVRADYRYSDYGTISNTDVRRFTPAAALVFGQDGFNVTYQERIRTNTAMIGVAHKLGW
jgi:outer membrane immunogenic protein